MDEITIMTTTGGLSGADARGLAEREPSSRTRARLQKAMATAALAAVLALGGVFGLRPRIAEATPKTLGAPAAAAGASASGTATGPAAAGASRERAGPIAGPDDHEPSGTHDDDAGAPRGGKHVAGRLNLNTATAAELMLLPGIGPAKAERVLTWRKRNGTFRRVADLRRVKGFGYRTVKRLEPHLDVKGETTLRAGP